MYKVATNAGTSLSTSSCSRWKFPLFTPMDSHSTHNVYLKRQELLNSIHGWTVYSTQYTVLCLPLYVTGGSNAAQALSCLFYCLVEEGRHGAVGGGGCRQTDRQTAVALTVCLWLWNKHYSVSFKSLCAVCLPLQANLAQWLRNWMCLWVEKKKIEDQSVWDDNKGHLHNHLLPLMLLDVLYNRMCVKMKKKNLFMKITNTSLDTSVNSLSNSSFVEFWRESLSSCHTLKSTPPNRFKRKQQL